MDLFPIFDAMEQTWLATVIKESLWYFPAIEAVHLLGLAMLGGAILVVDLRMLGLGLREQTIPNVAAAAQRWLVAAIVIMFATGIPLFLSEAVKCYFNTSFWVKMGALLTGLIFTFAVRNRVAVSGSASPVVLKLAGAFSIAVWFVVAAAGRWIGFS
jgi:hypothetical protein